MTPRRRAPSRSIPPAGSIPGQRTRRRKVRVWTFSEKPRFKRVDRMMLVAKSREPHVDVFDESEELVVVAQLPGVEKDAFQVEVRGDTVVITATAGTGQDTVEYRGEEIFPFPVEEEPLSVTFTNYILEVRFRRSLREKTGQQRR